MKRLLIIVLACCISGFGQEKKITSSFDEIKVDRSATPASVHHGIRIDAATGAFSQELPLGGGIGMRGVMFKPQLHGTYLPSASSLYYWPGPGNVASVAHGGTGGFDLMLPGTLEFQNQKGHHFKLPSGDTGSFATLDIHDVTALVSVPSVVNLDAMIKKYYGTYLPGRVQYTEKTACIGSNGELIIAVDGLNGVTGGEISYYLDGTALNAVPGPYTLPYKGHVPRHYLVIAGEICYEYTYQYHFYREYYGKEPGFDERLFSNPDEFMYYITKIQNVFGDRIDFSYVLDDLKRVQSYTAKFTSALDGSQMSVGVEKQSASLIEIKYSGMERNADYLLEYESPDQCETYYMGACNAAQGSYCVGENRLNQGWLLLDRQEIRPKLLTLTGTSDSVKWEYGRAPEASCSFPYAGQQINISSMGPLVPQKINLSNTTINLTWLPYQINLKGLVDWTGQDFIWGVNSIAEVDFSGESRVTQHIRKFPYTDRFSGGCKWASNMEYVGIIHPDGSVIAHRIVEPLDCVGSVWATEDYRYSIQYLANAKKCVRESRMYSPGIGDTWIEDLYKPLSESTAFKSISYDRWDVRGIPNPEGIISETSIPYPTRTIEFDRLLNIASVTEVIGWDRVSATWKNNHKWIIPGCPSAGYDLKSLESRSLLVSDPSGSNFHSIVEKTSDSVPEEWIYSRIRNEKSTIVFDLISTPDETIHFPFEMPIKTYDYSPYIKNRIESTTISSSDIWTKFLLNYYNDIPTSVNSALLSKVTQTGGPSLGLSGLVGVDNYGYDGRGNLASIKLAGMNWVTQQSQDSLRCILSQTDSNGIIVNYDWDIKNRLTSVRPDGTELGTTFVYDPDNRGVILTKGERRIQQRYNSFGELILEREGTLSSWIRHKVYGYDKGGRKTWSSIWLSGAGVDTEGTAYTGAGDYFAYNDPQSRLTDHTDPNGSIIHIQYLGLTKKVTKGYGTSNAATTTYLTDAMGRLIKVIDALGQASNYAYTPSGKVATVTQFDSTNTTSQTRTWAYNGFDWLTSITQPESGTTQHSDFTVQGKPQTTIYSGDGTGPARVLRTVYDSIGRVKSNISDDGTVSQKFTYDEPNRGASNGKLTTAVDNGITRALGYGGLNGRLSDFNYYIQDLPVFTQGLGYDNYGNLTSRTYPNGRVQFIPYDATIGAPNGTNYNGSSLATMHYDPIHWGLDSISYAGGASSFLAYDQDQVRLHRMTHTLGATTLSDWYYSYDDLGRLRSDGEDNYYYDQLDRLTSCLARDPFVFTDPANRIWQQISYDAFGNRLSLSSQVAIMGRPAANAPLQVMESFPLGGDTRDLRTYFSNDAEALSLANNNRLPASMGGIPTGVGVNGYDVQGNLTRIQRVPGSTISATNSLISMTYDTLGRVKTMADASRNIVEIYTYDDRGLRVLVEVYQGPVSPQNLVKKQYRIYNEARQLVSEYELVAE